MTNKQLDIIMDKELHPQAEKAMIQYINDFAVSVLLQAKLLAYRSKAELVLSNHVDEALDAVTKGARQPRSKELVIVIGGALFGAFVQGFVSELSSGNAFLIATYVVLGFVGMFLVFWGLYR